MKETIYRGEVNQLTVSLKHYFDNETKEIYEYDDDFNLPLDVTFFTDAGSLTTKKLVNGVATFDFDPSNEASVVYARINNQTLKIDNFQLRKTNIIANDFEKDYGSSRKLVIKLIKDNKLSISNENLTVYVGGSQYAVKTDKNGQVKLSLNDLAPDVYAATIIFAGSDNYVNSTKSISVIIKKATPKLIATKKTFKKSIKTKKYTITLKTNMNKVMKNTKVSLKINGKTYYAKTNGMGQATFKITNLKKKGTFTALVKYAGSKYYTAKTVKPKIFVK